MLVVSDNGVVPRSPRVRKRILLIAGAVLALALVVIVTLFVISAASDREVSVLIGTFGSVRMASLAVILALASLALGLCLVPVTRPWLVLLVPARLAAIVASSVAAFGWVITPSPTVVPLVSAGCETGYVVKETAFLHVASGTVYRTDGILVTAVGWVSGDDGYTPFDDGAYAVVDDGETLRVWYNVHFDRPGAPVLTDGAPDFTLPKLSDRTFACGISTHARTPQPQSPSPTAPMSDMQSSIREMVGVSLAATVGPVRDDKGDPIDPQAIAPVSSTCDAGGVRVEIALEFETADNASSLTRILSAWDAAGYARDRAMQEDIRYSESLPIERMAIRDSTSIDGLIHMKITSRCEVVQP